MKNFAGAGRHRAGGGRGLRVRVQMLPAFVYTCRRLIDLSLLCIYMPALDRPLSLS